METDWPGHHNLVFVYENIIYNNNNNNNNNLFLIYISNLPNCLSFSVPRMYADDTYITNAGSDLPLFQCGLSHDLKKPSK